MTVVVDSSLTDEMVRHAYACHPEESCGLLAGPADGDIRRAILASLPLEEPVSRLLAERPPEAGRTPITAPADTPPEALIGLMTEKSIRHLMGENVYNTPPPIAMIDTDPEVLKIDHIFVMPDSLEIIRAGVIGDRFDTGPYTNVRPSDHDPTLAVIRFRRDTDGKASGEAVQ